MAESERATGTPDTIYGLSSVLFHALEGGASYAQYIQDAEEAGDQELADFFIQVRDEDSMRADEAQRMIAERTAAAGLEAADTTVGGDLPPTRVGEAPPTTEAGSPRTEPISAPPREGDIPPRRTEEALPPGEVQRGMSDEPLPGTEETREGERARREEEDKGLVDKARDYLRGEGRERDYLRGE